MKRKITLAVSLLVMLVVASFALAESPAFIDGVYKGRGEGYNDYIEVEVIVEGGLIKEIKILYCEDTKGVWDLAVKRLTETMITEQTIEVDVISQATYSSEGFIVAVQNALKEAVK